MNLDLSVRMMIGSVTYFETPGKVNTDATLEIVKEKIVESGINTVVLPSGEGYTAKCAFKKFKDLDVKLVVISYSKSFPPELASEMEKKGHVIIHSDKHEFDHPDWAWELLRRFCEGMKVSVQGVLMATELGIIEEGEEVIGLGGTGTIGFEPGGGVDTAMVIQAAKGENFFALDMPSYDKKMTGRRIKEFLCKPR